MATARPSLCAFLIFVSASGNRCASAPSAPPSPPAPAGEEAHAPPLKGGEAASAEPGRPKDVAQEGKEESVAATPHSNETDRPAAHANETPGAASHADGTAGTAPSGTRTGSQVAALTTEVTSLKEQMRTVRRQLEILARGARSGLFEDHSSFEDGEREDAGKDRGTGKPAKRGIGEKHSKEITLRAPGRGSAPEMDLPAAPPHGGRAAESKSDGSPSGLVAAAELKMREGQYGEAVVLLAQVQRDSPQLDDGGRSLALLAECWLALGQYENVFPPVRTLYQRFPAGPHLLRAKLAEAQALEKQGSKESAVKVYREVLGRAPDSTSGHEARAGLQRVRDLR